MIRRERKIDLRSEAVESKMQVLRSIPEGAEKFRFFSRVPLPTDFLAAYNRRTSERIAMEHPPEQRGGSDGESIQVRKSGFGELYRKF